MLMNVFPTRDKSPQSKPYQNLTSIGLALLLCALPAFTPVSAQAAQGTDLKQAKRHMPQSAQPAKAKPQQRKKNVTPKKQATRPVHLAAVTGIALASSAQTQAWAQDAAQRLQLDPTWVQKTLAQAQRQQPHRQELGRLPRTLHRAHPHPGGRTLLANPSQRFRARRA
jgi:hypothetical protein